MDSRRRAGPACSTDSRPSRILRRMPTPAVACSPSWRSPSPLHARLRPRSHRRPPSAASAGGAATWTSPSATSRRKRPSDELDSLATWTAEDGRTWLIATGKSTHRLVVYDADSGDAPARRSAAKAAAPGQFDRPNGIAVYGDHAVRRRARQPSRAGAVAARLRRRRHLRRTGTAQPLRPLAATRPSRASSRSTSPTASCTARSSTKCRRWHELDQRVRRYRVQFDQAGRLRATYGGVVRRHPRGQRAAHGRIDRRRPAPTTAC